MPAFHRILTRGMGGQPTFDPALTALTPNLITRGFGGLTIRVSTTVEATRRARGRSSAHGFARVKTTREVLIAAKLIDVCFEDDVCVNIKLPNVKGSVRVTLDDQTARVSVERLERAVSKNANMVVTAERLLSRMDK